MIFGLLLLGLLLKLLISYGSSRLLPLLLELLDPHHRQPLTVPLTWCRRRFLTLWSRKPEIRFWHPSSPALLRSLLLVAVWWVLLLHLKDEYGVLGLLESGPVLWKLGASTPQTGQSHWISETGSTQWSAARFSQAQLSSKVHTLLLEGNWNYLGKQPFDFPRLPVGAGGKDLLAGRRPPRL